MKNIKILSIRKNTNSNILSIEEDYIKRLSQWIKVETLDIRNSYSEKQSEAEIINKEKDLYLKHLKANSPYFVLHESGKSFSSTDFSGWCEKNLLNSSETPTLLIGSAYGVHSELLKGAKQTISLSSMTLTHEHARLILIEQIYRAFTILNNGNYHK